MKISLYVWVYTKTISWKFCILNLPVWFVNFLKSRIIFNILYCFLNVCKQTFHISHVRISQKAQSVLIWNLQHIISIWWPRYWQIVKSALVCLKWFLFSHETLHFVKFEGADFKYINMFSNLQLKIPKQSIFAPKFAFFYLNNFLHFGNFEDADFKYNNSLSNLRAKIPK